MSEVQVNKTVYSMSVMSEEEIGKVLAEIERQKKTKKDYIADTRRLRATVADKQVLIAIPAEGEDTLFGIKPTARRQLAAHFKVPADYFGRLLGEEKHLSLAAQVLNHHFQADPSKRMLRTLDGMVRSFPANTYKPLDNADLFFAAYEEFQKLGAEIWFARLSDDHFRLYAVAPGTTAEVTTERGFGQGHDIRHFRPEDGGTGGKPDTFHPAVALDNSETGCGGLNVMLSTLRTACTNLMVTGTGVMSIHRGARKEEEGFLSEKTVAAESQVTWMKVRDLIRTAFDQEKFKTMIDRLNGATQDAVEDPLKVVEAVGNAYYVPEDVKNSIRDRFVKSPDRTRYGLIQAVTFEAHNTGLGADTRNLLEDVGGKLLDTTVKKLLVAAGDK